MAADKRRYLNVCPQCGQQFNTENRRQVMCSRACYGAAIRGKPKHTRVSDDLTKPPTDPNAAAAIKITALEHAVMRYRKLYQDALASSAEEQRVLELFRTAIAAFPVVPAATHRRARPRVEAPRAVETPALILSDLHIGEVIKPEEVRGVNRYDFATFQARLEHLEGRVLDILTQHQRAQFPELVVLMLGDQVSGVIHAELEKHGAQHIVDQVYLGALTVALFFSRLARLSGLPVRVLALSGNHGRLKPGKPEQKQYYKNFDYLFNSIAQLALAQDPRVQMIIPQAIFDVIEVGGQRILCSHGHELPPSSLGIPLYGINRASAQYHELLAMSGEARYDWWVMGHYHRPLALDRAIVNGCMSGLSELTVGRAFKPIEPMQLLVAFHPTHGKAWEYPIRLDAAPPASIYTLGSEMKPGDALERFARAQESIA